jgi:Na+-driven multidrug efflux pump
LFQWGLFLWSACFEVQFVAFLAYIYVVMELVTLQTICCPSCQKLHKASWNNFMSLKIHIRALLMIENLYTSPWSFVKASWGPLKTLTRAKVPIALMHLSWHICTIWHISFTKIMNPSSRSKLHHKFKMWRINNENCVKFVHS